MSQNFITFLISFMNVTDFYNSINFFFENVNSQLIVIIKALVYSCPNLINLTSICTEMLAKFKIPNIYLFKYFIMHAIRVKLRICQHNFPTSVGGPLASKWD